MALDVRSVANFVLDFAARRGREVSNMQVNKVVYFLHADYLAAFSRPLVSAKIEAWEHGPVFRELYHMFKEFDDRPITSRATKIDPESGMRVIVVEEIDAITQRFLEDASERYTVMSAATLRALSHVPDGPWDLVWNHETDTRATMRITDESILDWYRSARH